MANKLLFRVAVLLALAAIIICVSAKVKVEAGSGSSKVKKDKKAAKEEKSDEAKSGSGSGSDEKKSGSGEDSKSGSEETTTKASKQKEKYDSKAFEKLLIGRYSLTTDTKSDDFVDFIKAMKFSKVNQNTIANSKIIEVNIQKKGKNKYEVFYSAGYNHGIKAFEVGMEGTYTLMDLRKYQATITFKGKNKVVTEEKHVGFKCKNVMEFSTEGFTLKLNCNGKKAEQEYERK